MTKPSRKFHAWAIQLDCEKVGGCETHPIFVGKLWAFSDKPPKIPRQFQGCEVCLFKNRDSAREFLPAVRRAFTKAKVVRVNVSIEK